jgi:hypothetical protein
VLRFVFFSADDIFRYRKTGVDVIRGRAEVKLGRGGPYLELWPNRSQAHSTKTGVTARRWF